MTVTVPQDSNKRKVQSNEGAPCAKRPCRAGKPRGDKKQTKCGDAPPPTISASQRTTMPNVFLVHKASGGWRPVIDLKELNDHIDAPHFHMYTISSVLNTVERGDYVFKIDLLDAYFHVLIHPDSRKYLCFAIENMVYQFPFGLNTALRYLLVWGHSGSSIVRGY